MIILVDGYNVLKRHSSPGKHVSQKEKDRFVVQCASYARKKHHTLILFFDGGPYARPVELEEHGITVIYASYKSTADDLIHHYLNRYTGKEVMLVSSDNELVRYATAAQAYSMDAEDFYMLIQGGGDFIAKPRTASKVIKTAESSHAELDELMQHYGIVINHKEEVPGVIKKQKPAKMLSKTKRNMMKKIKKL